jgi:hypothetical protein
VDELPGFAGGGGAFAAGGGEAGGAGRAGGIVGIADFGTGFAAVAERVAVAELVGGAVGDAADGAEGRLASADVADVGFAAPAGRVAEAVGAAELAARAGAAAAGADLDAEPDTDAGAGPDADADPSPDADPDAVDADPVEADPDAAFDARAWAGVEPVGVALVFAGAADVRGAVPVSGVCATADLSAGADVFEAGGVASDDEAVARGDFREPEVDVEDATDVGVEGKFAVEADADADAPLGAGVAGAAERVGGAGESPDPKSETSSTGEAQVPEYAISEGAAAHEPEVELVAEAPGALEAEEPPDAMERAKAVAPAAEVPSAAGADLELPAFVAAAGLVAWPDVAPATGGIPNPAGDFCESVAVEDFAAAAGV